MNDLDYSGYFEEDSEQYQEIKDLAISKLREDRIKESMNRKENIVFRHIPLTERYDVLKRQNWKCNSCGARLKFSKEQNWEAEIAHIDHIHPYSKRKSYPNGEQNINESSNLQALCPSCNLSKSKREIN